MKRILKVFCAVFILCSLLAPSVFSVKAYGGAAQDGWVPYEGPGNNAGGDSYAHSGGQSLSRLTDNADLLTDAEEAELSAYLDKISARHRMDIVIVTNNSLHGQSPQRYAEDFYDYNGYGMDEYYSGILLLVSMEYREWYISTTGYGRYALDDRLVDEIADAFLPDLSDGRYADAFEIFAEQCDMYIEAYNQGTSHSYNSVPAWMIPLCLVMGMVILANIPMFIMRSKMKPVALKAEANNYMKDGSLLMTQQRDVFLYSTVSRRKIEKQSNSHKGHSGRAHGGGGGKF